jgi:choline-sulfatase
LSYTFINRMLRKLLPIFPLLLALSSSLAFAEPPNIILITLDTTRADRMGFMGSSLGLTPNLDILAKQSIVFTRAYAQVPLTTPSHAAILTGTYPQFSHVEDLGSRLPKDVPYLPDLLHRHGYHTAAFVGAEILDPASTAPGFERGFDVYDADFHTRKPGEDRYKSIERRAEDVANRALGWLSRNQKGPFFIWLHFYDPHDPYDPPEPFKTHYATDEYNGEIAYTDSVVGSVMDVLQRHGLYQKAVIAIAADHGEAFGEHGEERHGVFLYDETIHVPLLLKLPGERTAGVRVEDRVALAAIAPSLLEAAGISAPAAMQARSLYPLIVGAKASSAKKSPSVTAIYSESNYAHRTFGWAVLRSWREDKYLYVEAPTRELYDQSLDPAATKNLATASRAIADTLNTQLDTFRQESGRTEVKQANLDASQVEKLRALGYAAADTGSPSPHDASADGGMIDPKDKIEVVNKFHHALMNMGEGRYEEGIADLREVVRLDPAIGSAYLELGRALAHEKQHTEALPILRMAAEKLPYSGITHQELGLLLLRMGNWEDALHEMQAAVVCSPDSAVMHFNLAAVYTHLKHVPEAITEYEKALAIDPNYFDANFTYGRLLLIEGHADAALPKLSRAAKVNPKSAEAHMSLSTAYEKLGQTANASVERAKAAQLNSQQPE